MPFYIIYEEKGVHKRERFVSYYEFIKRKTALTKRGYTLETKADGLDVEKNAKQIKMSPSEKRIIAGFLEIAEKVNIKSERDKENYWKGKANAIE